MTVGDFRGLLQSLVPRREDTCTHVIVESLVFRVGDIDVVSQF